MFTGATSFRPKNPKEKMWGSVLTPVLKKHLRKPSFADLGALKTESIIS